MLPESAVAAQAGRRERRRVLTTLSDGIELLRGDLEPVVDVLARVVPRGPVMTAPEQDRLVLDLVELADRMFSGDNVVTGDRSS